MSLFQAAITPTGYTRVSQANIIATQNALYLTAYGADADLDPRSPEGQIIGGSSEMYSDLEGGVADLYNGLANPNGATGQFLSNILLLAGLRRQQGMASYVPVTFAGTPSTSIPANTLLQSTLADGRTATWSSVYTLNPSTGAHTPGGTIAGGGSSSNVWAVCTVVGPTTCPAGTPMAILSTTTGLDSVAVASSATVGYMTEGDPNARIRRTLSFGLASQGMADGLEAALNNMTGVVAQAAVWENNTGIIQTFAGGGTLNPHSIRPVVVVAAGAPDDYQHQIAQKIYDLKGGCGTQGGTIDTTAEDEQGNTNHPISFDIATAKRVGVKLTYTTRAGWPSDGAQQIATLIGEWAADRLNTPLGGDSAGEISWTSILGSFVGKVPGFDFTSGGMQLGYGFGEEEQITWLSAGTNLPLTFLQYASILATDIIVNGVYAFPA
jgi:hypothetical protein